METHIYAPPDGAEDGAAEDSPPDFRRPRGPADRRARRAGRIREGTTELAKALDGLELGSGVHVLFRAGTEHRAALVLRGPGLSPHVSDTDPHDEGARVLSAKATASDGESTARAVNEFMEESHKILRAHPVNVAREKAGRGPANVVLLRGAGVVPHLDPVKERLGMRAAGIAGVALIKGMFRAAGMDVLEVTGATGGLGTDVVAKARAAVAAFKENDLFFVNVKAADGLGAVCLVPGKGGARERDDD